MAENEEELKSITGEESLNSFMELVQKLKDEPWTSRLNDILDAFEDFLTIRPEPPQSWQDNYAASGKKFDYYQIVLPEDFIFENGHAEPIPAPRPILMLESKDRADDEQPQEGDITWDCCISIFADGSYVAYNLDHDDEEELGEDFKVVFEKHIKTLSKLQLVIPVEGRDYGILRSDA